MLYDKSQWGFGFGLEALKAVCDFAFNKIGLHRIVADYYKENIPSSKIFEKAGFTVEGIFKDHFVNNGNSTHVLGIDGNGMSPVSDIKRIGENTAIDENFVSFLLLLKHDAKLYAEYIMPEI